MLKSMIVYFLINHTHPFTLDFSIYHCFGLIFRFDFIYLRMRTTHVDTAQLISFCRLNTRTCQEYQIFWATHFLHPFVGNPRGWPNIPACIILATAPDWDAKDKEAEARNFQDKYWSRRQSRLAFTGCLCVTLINTTNYSYEPIILIYIVLFIYV